MSLEKNPVIAAVRTEEGLAMALKSPVSHIFLLSSDVLSLKDKIKEAHSFGKKIFIHVDFTEGLGKDKVGLKVLHNFSADGIISTRTNIIKMAKDLGLLTVQRFFLVDSHSYDTAIESIKSAHPDMIEVMPGLVSREIKKFTASLKIPVIAGGLIETKEEIYEALSSGASAISTGKADLWK